MDLLEELRVRDSNQWRQLIEMHLSFVIDSEHFASLTDQRLNGKKNKLNNNSDHYSNGVNRDANTIFGAPLTHEGICGVFQLIEFVSKDYNLKQEGIFRKSGSTSRQLELRGLIAKGVTIDLEDKRFTVHDACGVLKAFLSELPEPLLTESHFELHRQISKLSPSKRLKAIQLLLLLLPATNKKLLQDLSLMFAKIIENCDTNKMNSLSLATIFAPHFFCPRHYTAIEMQIQLNAITNQLVFMIDNINAIFETPKELLRDVKKALSGPTKTVSNSSLAAVNTMYTFCVPQTNVSSDTTDYTAKQVAELYAYLNSMPESRTPQKKRWIKKFNQENGNGTPLLKKTSDSNKKTKIGGVLKAGQNFFFRNSAEVSKLNKIRDKDSNSNRPAKKSRTEKFSYYERLDNDSTPKDSNRNKCDAKSETVIDNNSSAETLLSDSFDTNTETDQTSSSHASASCDSIAM